MWSSDDSYSYKDYALLTYAKHRGPPIIHKKSRLIAAVVQNQVGVLQDLLGSNSPEWYTATDKDGFPLLQIAILAEKKEIFDYLLSIPDFPIDFKSRDGQTALVIALDYYISDECMRQDFACELIKKGASLDVICSDYSGPFHTALERSFDRVATILIEKGVDVNVYSYYGYIPLELAFYMSQGIGEVVPALLIHGATPSVYIFEDAVRDDSPFFVQEMLFLYLFDEHSNLEVALDVILELADTKSPLFGELLKCISKVDFEDSSCLAILCSLNFDALKMFTEKFGDSIRATLITSRNWYRHIREEVVFMDNLNFLIENGFLNEVLLSVNRVDVRLIQALLSDGIGELFITKLCCYLLSYGLKINEWDLQLIYKHFGYSDFFKLLLHMDIQMGIEKKGDIRFIMPTMIYNVTMDLDQFFIKPDKYCKNSFKELGNHFASSKLKDLIGGKSISEIRGFPEVPLLTELARNVFRKYFVSAFQIKTSRKFHTLLNCLPISTFHKKILSYETELY